MDMMNAEQNKARLERFLAVRIKRSPPRPREGRLLGPRILPEVRECGSVGRMKR